MDEEKTVAEVATQKRAPTADQRDMARARAVANAMYRAELNRGKRQQIPDEAGMKGETMAKFAREYITQRGVDEQFAVTRSDHRVFVTALVVTPED